MKKFIKRTILAILLIICMLAVSALDSNLDGWWFVLEILLCAVPVAVIAWLCSNDWFDDIDVEE